MKVRPYRKHKTFSSNEMRVINIDNEAIAEILFENLTENSGHYFNIDNAKEELIFCMNWDQEGHSLSYAALPLKILLEGYRLNFDYIKNSIGYTTKSLFQPNCCMYKSIYLTEQDKGTVLLSPEGNENSQE